MRATIKPLIQKALFLLLNSLAGASYAQIPQIERDALVALYNSTDGANWTDNTGWMGAAGTECFWFGVTCTSGVVTQLSLGANSLTGTIPAELGNLTNLTMLYLNNNELVGEIPPELGNLTKLTMLNLGYNYSFIGRKTPKEPGLTGEIPRELGNLVNLTYLNLGWNNLTGTIPNELGKLTKLRTIFLAWTQLSGPVPEGLQKIFPDPTSFNYFVDEELKFFRDVDQDGIDDQIDLDLESSAPIKTINESDYSISISGSGRVVNLVSPFLFSEINQNTYLPWEIGKQIGKIIYSHFNDEFDFLFLSTNIQHYNTDINYLGLFRQIKNSTGGLGGLNNWAKIFDDSDLYGSDGKLQGIVHFPYIHGINQVGLHEIMHHWANYILETGETGHWGYTNIGGQLGGWKPNTLEKLNDGNYKTSGPLYTSWTGRSTNKNLLPYSNFELYLMGLIGADEVGHDIKIARDFNWVDSSNGTFEASSIETITMDEIIAKNGKREPSYLTSQKDFTAMNVVISEQPLTRQEWISVDRSIFNFQLKGDDGYPGYNFWEATQGKATMELGQLDTYLTSQASLSYLVTSPVVSIVGGDRTIADSDKVTGELVNLTATASDSDGTIATTQWLVDGVEVGTGLSASVSLPNGSTVVTFKATDNSGESTTTTATITIEAPAYTPTEVWPAPYSGVTPDTSLGLAFNNIGIFNSSDATIYACLRLFTNGLPSSVNGVGEFDIGLEVVSLSDLTVQITKSREFNTIGALNEKVQAPDCSGIFETTTGLYTDILQANTSVLETVWSLIDSTKLILKLISSKELTAN